MSTKTELINRWDGFLTKMEERYLESLQHAENACMEQLEETDYDYYTVFRSWQGMKAQISQLSEKIDDTWHTKVRPQMMAIDDGSHFYIDESHKAGELTDKLSQVTERFQTVLEGKLSQKFYNHAIEIANRDFNCSQCGAPLEVVKDLFRAQYITCGACNSVNTFKPETKFVQIGWNTIDNMVALQCLPLHDAMSSALEEIQSARKENQTEEQWQKYRDAYFTYWETYFKERITLKSDAADRYEKDMQRKTTEFEEFMNIQRYNRHEA